MQKLKDRCAAECLQVARAGLVAVIVQGLNLEALQGLLFTDAGVGKVTPDVGRRVRVPDVALDAFDKVLSTCGEAEISAKLIGMKTEKLASLYRGYRFPAEIISHFQESEVSLVECPDCACTRTLEPHGGELRFKLHNKRKTTTPNTGRRWVKRDTAWEMTGRE